MLEKWKEIKGYYISNCGNIKNKKGEILSPYELKRGYKRITLHVDKKVKNFLIHRLVAEAFIKNPNNLPQINHIDENKSNNHVDNLEWCDNKYNCNYGDKNAGRSKSVLQYDLNGNFIKEYKSITKAANNNFCLSSISMCCLEKRKQHNNFIWKFKENINAV